MSLLTNFEPLRELLLIPSQSRREHRVVGWLVQQAQAVGAQVEVDSCLNVYMTKGRSGLTSACVAAHTDTVQPDVAHRLVEQDGFLHGEDARGNLTGIGADNKTGVFVCLELLRRASRLRAVFFAAEEIGCVGAYAARADFFDRVGCLVEFDCPSRQMLTHTCSGERLFASRGEFIRTAEPVLSRFGTVHWQRHPYTDVMAIRRRFPISCLNLSSGYYNWHAPNEFVYLPDVVHAVAQGQALLDALGHRSYPFHGLTESQDAEPLRPVTCLHVPHGHLPDVPVYHRLNGPQAA